MDAQAVGVSAEGWRDDTWEGIDDIYSDQATADALEALAEQKAAAPEMPCLDSLAFGAHLPDDFYESRPAFEHIRQAARSRMLAPDAVFGAVLIRVAASTSHTVEIPAIVGAPCGLTLFAALVGPPSSGKSSSVSLAGDLVPAPDGVIDRLPVGSGEGFVECLFEIVDETDEKGKTVKVKRQTKYAAIFHVDEGSVLADLGKRSGAILLPTFRSAWSHGVLGSTNASVERNRILPGERYVFGCTVALQDAAAGPLLAQVDVGTPQRFLWLSAVDPNATDEATSWPGELAWQPPDVDDLVPRHESRKGVTRHPLVVHRSVVEAVRARHLAAVRGEGDPDPFASHGDLMRLKVAAVLAILEHRGLVNEEDWRLAGTVTAVSRQVRRDVQATLERIDRGKDDANADRTARRELRVEDTKAHRALQSASKSVANVVATHDEQGRHKDQGGGCTRRCFSQAIASKHRELIAVDDIISQAQRNGWIIEEGDRWTLGESRPA